MTNEILKINDLNKSFAKRKVINKLNLTVSRGYIYMDLLEQMVKEKRRQSE